MSVQIKIAQITDLHIGLPEDKTFDVDVRGNFIQIIQKVKSNEPDLLVISGDLCFREPLESVYSWVRNHVKKLAFPTLVIPGNHDDPLLLAKKFGLTKQLDDKELYYEFFFNDHHLIFLDTSKAICSEKQLQWLNECLKNSCPNKMVFMHHPPAYCDVPFMDNNYPFKQNDKLLEIFKSYQKNLPIFCGHYHVDKLIVQDNVIIHITPSTFFQIDQKETEFKVDHKRIGFREIISDEYGMRSSVHYLQ